MAARPRPNSVEYGNSKTTTLLPSAKCTRPLLQCRTGYEIPTVYHLRGGRRWTEVGYTYFAIFCQIHGCHKCFLAWRTIPPWNVWYCQRLPPPVFVKNSPTENLLLVCMHCWRAICWRQLNFLSLYCNVIVIVSSYIPAWRRLTDGQSADLTTVTAVGSVLW